MADYIDGFVFPIAVKHLDEYKKVAESVANIWKEHGALSYSEYVGDDLLLEGTGAFPDFLGSNEDEVVVFGWVSFESREARDKVNKLVSTDPRMANLISPLTDPTRMIFDAERMAYAGFKPLIRK